MNNESWDVGLPDSGKVARQVPQVGEWPAASARGARCCALEATCEPPAWVQVLTRRKGPRRGGRQTWRRRLRRARVRRAQSAQDATSGPRALSWVRRPSAGRANWARAKCLSDARLTVCIVGKALRCRRVRALHPTRAAAVGGTNNYECMRYTHISWLRI